MNLTFNLTMICLALLCGLFSNLAFSYQIQNETQNIDYVIEGLNKTDSSVIETEIKICQCVNEDEVLKQTLLRTGLFYDVQIQIIDQKKHIRLKEKWTTIPIFKVNSGGGVQGYTLGVYDPHILGRRIEIGTQFESLAGAPSVVFWNKIPRLFQTRFFSDIQIWRTQRIRLKYDQTLEDPTLVKALLQKSDRDYLALGYEWSDDFKVRIFFENQLDQFSLDRIPDSTLNQIGPQSIPDSTQVLSTGLQFEIGNTQLIRHSQVGTSSQLLLKISSTDKSQQKSFQSAKWETLHYTLIQDFLLGARLQIGSTNTEFIQFWNYLGGFESIRGFKDNRFATRNYWLTNLEGRYYLIEKDHYILQSTGFVDMVGIDEQDNNIENIHAVSVGAGARLILPKFYRVTIRFDYAQPFIKSDDQKISFGVQQFF